MCVTDIQKFIEKTLPFFTYEQKELGPTEIKNIHTVVHHDTF